MVKLTLSKLNQFSLVLLYKKSERLSTGKIKFKQHHLSILNKKDIQENILECL
ncbi:hypothetical protein HMPREF1115_1699 [Streptococcus oralis SK610]|uniref:Uncharacterized protein n=1 Tax=Streptococcus oralis SK610 TaxID=1095741 RepID=I0Q5G8_STROR|nr:hypothetical protein HMPREF1115_1699 [Streptococcus oralis SK610]